MTSLGKWIPFGKVDEISAEDLHQLITNQPDDVILVDVRTLLEWKSGHIKNATHIHFFNFNQEIENLNAGKDKIMVPICLSAHRSIPAVRLLKEKGYKNVQQLKGGMLAWNKLYKSALEKS